MFKKMISVPLICIVLLFCVTVANAEKGEKIDKTGKYKYVVLKDKSVKLIDFIFDNNDIYGIVDYVIPDKIDGKAVSVLDCEIYLQSIKTVTIPASIVSIEKNPFSACPQVEEIIVSPENPIFQVIDDVLYNVPEKKAIGYAPHGNMENVQVVPGTEIIGKKCFRNVFSSGPISVSLPDSIKIIEEEAFWHCYKMEPWELPSGLEEIGIGAFEGCGHYSSSIPSSVKRIDEFAFRGCWFKSIDLPEGLRFIGNRAFCECKALVSVVLPDSLEEMGQNPFSACDNLLDIILSSDNPYFEIRDGLLIESNEHRLICRISHETQRIEKFSIPDDIVTIGGYAFENLNTEEFVIPASVTVLDEYAFNGSLINKINIPDTVKEIRAYAFSDCSALSDVTLPSNLKVISEGLFNSSGHLRTIRIPNKVTTIENYAFRNCRYFENLYIPKSVKKIGDYTFDQGYIHLIVWVYRGSYADKYCKNHHLARKYQ